MTENMLCCMKNFYYIWANSVFFHGFALGFVVVIVFNNRQLACSPPCVSVICYYVINDMPGQNGCTSKKMPHKRDMLYAKVGVLKNVLTEM